jgi:hypothetical protein
VPVLRYELGKEQHGTPCEPQHPGRFRAERFVGEGVVIRNALGASGPSRSFCCEWDGVATLRGPSLQYPWVRLAAGIEVPVERSGSSWVAEELRLVVRKRKGALTLALGGGPTYALASSGLENRVRMARADGSVVAEFPAVKREVRVPSLDLSSEDALALVVVIGTGAVRRARRGGLVARLYLPGTAT